MISLALHDGQLSPTASEISDQSVHSTTACLLTSSVPTTQRQSC